MVEKDKRYDELSTRFVTQMYHKGYRKNFSLNVIDTRGIHFFGPLSESLKMFLNLYVKSGKTEDRFRLETQQDYKSARDHIACTFKVDFDDTAGFHVREINIRDALSGQGKIYRLANNNQIPGAASLQGLFPRPKPWDDLIKGKSRFRR